MVEDIKHHPCPSFLTGCGNSSKIFPEKKQLANANKQRNKYGRVDGEWVQ